MLTVLVYVPRGGGRRKGQAGMEFEEENYESALITNRLSLSMYVIDRDRG